MSDSPRHLDDGTLLRYLDGEGAAAERAGWEAHLAACGRCRGDLAELRRLTNGVSADVAAIIPSRPMQRATAARFAANREQGRAGRRGLQPPLRVAAVLLVLLLPILTVEPLRAWVTQWAREAAGISSSPAAPHAPGTSVGPAEGEIRFVPAAPQLVIEVTSRQAAGRLTLVLDDPGAVGILEFVNAGGREGALLSERGVRIETDAASTASYRLRLPAEVRRAVVRIAREAELIFAPSGELVTVEIELGPLPASGS